MLLVLVSIYISCVAATQCLCQRLPANSQLKFRQQSHVSKPLSHPPEKKTRVRNHGLGSHLDRKFEHDTDNSCCYVVAHQMVDRYLRTDPARKAEAYRIYVLES